MSKFSVSYSETGVVFVNTKTNKAETLACLERVDAETAIRGLYKEFKGRESASAMAVSLISDVLASARLDGYRGVTALNEAIPKEAKQAMRDAERDFIYPIFKAELERKGNTPAYIEKTFQEYISDLRDGGSYANARSIALSFFTQIGRTPVAENGKLLTVAAMKKLIENAKSDLPDDPKVGISGKLVALAQALRDRNEKTELGSLPEAVHALRDMLATFEGLEREAAEAITAQGIIPATTTQGAAAVASAAVAQAKASAATQETENTALADKERTLWIKYNDASIDLHEFTLAMHEIGITVNEDGDDVTVDSSYLSEDDQVALM